MLTIASSSVPNRPKEAPVQDAMSPRASVEELLGFERMLADLSARFANIPA
jgi:hypothetical protein